MLQRLAALFAAAALAAASATVVPGSVAAAPASDSGTGLAAAAATSATASTASTVPRKVRIAAAGDIACEPGRTRTPTTCQQAATARLISNRGAGAVLPLGDTQYDEGELISYLQSYDTTWGTLKDKTYPVPGNHEYYTPEAAGYYAYFGDRAHGPPGYYAYDLGRWRLYALNSACNEVDCAAQAAWLRQDLAANPHRCTLAYMHEARFSSGLHGDSSYAAQLWPVLDRRQVDVVLAGHDHDYERFAPMTAAGSVSAQGIRSWVVGTGGKELREFETTHVGSRVRSNALAGVLFMALRPREYTWAFRTIDGRLRDSGTARCVV